MAKKDEASSSATTTATAAQKPSVTNAPDQSEKKANRPERSWGPFAGGFGVSIFGNQTAEGRRFRSIVISPRRYQDNGVWKDAASFRPVDLESLILALQSAKDYCKSTPMPGEMDGAVEPEAPTDTDDVPW